MAKKRDTGGLPAVTAAPARKDHSPSGALKLDTLAGIRTEMARLYRLALKGSLETWEATRLTFILKEIRCCVEAEALTAILRRLDELSETVERRPGNGRAIDHSENPTAH